ncbi:MAG: type 4a pilus biogenesis protein PilO [Deltaproteobacteria bacterium]|nr:type 4a pilus biogenesis protein PilO [Deltaproteobacteria bacterium]
MAWGGSKVDWTQEANSREKVMVAVLLLAVLYVFGTYVWGVQWAKKKELQGQIDTVKMQVEAMQKLLAAQPTVVQQKPVVPAGTVSVAEDARFAPYLRGEIKTREEVMKEVVTGLTAPSSLQGVELTGFSFSQEKDEGHYVTVPFDLRVKGPFSATVGYLERIEKLPLMAVLDQAVIASPPENRAQLSTAIRGLLFVVKSAAALAPSGAVPIAPAAGGGGGH